MLLGLSKIIETPDSELPFRTELDLHDLQFGGSYPVQEPVRAEGSVRNVAGVLVLQATVSTTLHATCDRCAAEFLREVSYPVEAVLTRELEDEDAADEWTFQAAVPPGLQGSVLPLRQESERRSLRVPSRNRSPFGCPWAAVEG